MILANFIDLYSMVVIAAVIVSWIQLPYNNPIVQFLATLTEPLLEPIRRLLPSMGGIDLSPMVLFFGLRILRSMVAGAF